MSREVSDVVELWSEHSFRIRVPEDLLYFDGHFEGEPILAAVVQLDVIILPRIEKLWPDLGAVERATKMKFRSPIRANEEVTVRLKRKTGKKSVEVAMIRGELECASGTLSFR
jgi:3-hydroxymyristoyl/3-hydroxydecanoyl-(acyl carrier protein) dehydratase